jgi:hypothetical protein
MIDWMSIFIGVGGLLLLEAVAIIALAGWPRLFS